MKSPLFAIALLLCALFSPHVNAQMTGFSAELDTIWHAEGAEDISGFEFFGVYKVYADFTNPTDVLSALYSDVNALGTPPLGAEFTCDCFTSSAATNASLAGINPAFFSVFPDFEYSSGWTIGLANSGESTLDTQDPSFTGDIGSPYSICDGITVTNGSFYVTAVLEDGLVVGPLNAVAGDDLRVLVAQVTTCGDFNVQACVQVFPGGVQEDEQNFCPPVLSVIHPYVDGECVNDADGDGICDEFDAEILGCTNPLATGQGCEGLGYYNPEATVDDGSCLFDHPCTSAPCMFFTQCSGDSDGNGICDNIEESLSACLDPMACNYYGYTPGDFPGIPCFDDGSCSYEGCSTCWDVNACNYDLSGVHDCMGDGFEDCCIYDDYCGCDGTQLDAIGVCGGDCSVDSDGDGICDDEDDCIDANQNGLCDEDEDIDNCNQDSDNDGVPDCADDCPFGDFDNDGLCDADDPCVGVVDVLGICGGNCTLDNDSNGVCDDEEVYGCAYELADNYDGNVTRDDGSCVFPCEGVVNTNVFDWDGDYVVTVTDFLMMLSVYGDTDVDLDGVWDSGDDCVDVNACNYANDPSEPCAYIDVLGVCGGGCEGDEDADGICDDIDTCIGVEDECGVCNGPGPTEVVIDDITILYDSVYLPQLDEWYVYEFGADTTFSYTCAPFFGACGDPVGYQGYDYATVLIGDQCWFGENLRSANYENGDAIPTNLSDSEWQYTTAGAVAVYGEDSGCNNYSPDIDACDPAQSLEEYGRLYNLYAVDDVRGLCPSGWHVPTDGEWTVMTDELGGLSIAGGQMKTTYGWYNGGHGTNSSGFSGLPGGFRFNVGNFNVAGYLGSWWSSSPIGFNAWARSLNFDLEDVSRGINVRRSGLSVRCVRDAE